MARKRKESVKGRRVSIWVGLADVGSEVDLLRDLAGVAEYSLDNQDVIVHGERKHPVGKLLSQLSYSSSFLSQATEAATAHGITLANFVLAQYDFEFKPGPAPLADQEFVFIGHFEWNDSEDDPNA